MFSAKITFVILSKTEGSKTVAEILRRYAPQDDTIERLLKVAISMITIL